MPLQAAYAPLSALPRRALALLGALILLPLFALLSFGCGILDDDPFIAFSAGQEGERDIYVARADGSDLRAVVFHPSADDFAPVWSPDRTRIAYLSNRDGNVEIYVTVSLTEPANPMTSMRVTNTGVDESSVVWSPDGRRLAYVSPEGDGTPRVYWVDLANLRPNRLLFGHVGEQDPAWSPDGEWVAISVLDEQREPMGIFLRNPGGVNSLQVSHTADYAPAWSPDSKRLAFVSSRRGNQDVYVAEVREDGSISQQINVTPHPADDWGPVWDPSSGRILFFSDRVGSANIMAVEADGSALVPLTENDAEQTAFDYGPGGVLVFSSIFSGRADIFLMDEDGANQRPLPLDFPDRPTSQPDW